MTSEPGAAAGMSAADLIDMMERVLHDAEGRGHDTVNARRFFDVGEFELVHAELAGLAQDHPDFAAAWTSEFRAMQAQFGEPDI